MVATETFKRVCRIGIADLGYGGPGASVFITVRIRDNGELSITGVEGPNNAGGCRGGCGQIEINPDSFTSFAKGWDRAKVEKLRDIWKRWHMNNMRAGCEHQRALGWNKYDEHPSEPCPTCGYKYGSAWLKEELPQDVIDWLMTLPTADKPSPWRD